MGDIADRWKLIQRYLKKKFFGKSKKTNWRNLLKSVLLVGLAGGAVSWLIQTLILRYPKAMDRVASAGDAQIRGLTPKPVKRSEGVLAGHLASRGPLWASAVAPLILWRLFKAVIARAKK